MSSITLIPGATHVLKLTPNNSMIPETIPEIDSLFSLSKLAESKFSSWNDIATSANKISVVDSDSSLEVPRYIDSNFNMTGPEGTLWFLSTVRQNKPYYLQTGDMLSKSNSSSVFTIPEYVASSGYTQTSGINVLNRCGDEPHSHAVSILYDQPGKIDKSVGFNSKNSVITYNDDVPLGFSLLTKFTVKILMKVIDTTAVAFRSFGGRSGVCYAFQPDETTIVFMMNNSAMGVLNIDGVLHNDTWFLIDTVFDGTLIGNENRLKVYIDGQLQTLSFLYDNIPEITTVGEGSFDFGMSAASFIGSIDETRVSVTKAESSNEILLKYNQWMNNSSYWTVTVQPVISSVTNISNKRWYVSGSGFKPETTDPSGTIEGVLFIVEPGATNTCFILQEAEGTPTGPCTLMIINSDSEMDYTLITDNIAPIWSLTYPKVVRTKNNVTHYLVHTDSNGTAYFVAVPSGSNPVSSLQVKLGQDSSSRSVEDGFSGSVSLTSNIESTFSSRLFLGKNFDVYFVAEDSLFNLQENPVKIQVNIPEVLPINTNKPGRTFSGVTIAGSGNVDSKIPKVTSFFRNVNMPNVNKHKK